MDSGGIVVAKRSISRLMLKRCGTAISSVASEVRLRRPIVILLTSRANPSNRVPLRVVHDRRAMLSEPQISTNRVWGPAWCRTTPIVVPARTVRNTGERPREEVSSLSLEQILHRGRESAQSGLLWSRLLADLLLVSPPVTCAAPVSATFGQ